MHMGCLLKEPRMWLVPCKTAVRHWKAQRMDFLLLLDSLRKCEQLLL